MTVTFNSEVIFSGSYFIGSLTVTKGEYSVKYFNPTALKPKNLNDLRTMQDELSEIVSKMEELR